jgi:hypothetical protein
MARTATKAKPKEELELPVVNPDADNHHLVYTLAATNSPDQLPPGAMTGAMADEFVRNWQQQGYRILASETIQSGDVNGIYTLQRCCHLVKE